MLRIWWIAARPGSLVKVVLPVGVGLSIGFAHVGGLRPFMIGAALLYAWLVQLQIIFFNDYADADADSLHSERFPELIDARAIPNGWLSRRALLIASVVALVASLVLVAALAQFFARPWALLFGGAAIIILWAYSFRPLRLNYRGMGELLETIGVGGVLPWAGFYFYTGEIAVPVLAIGPLLFLALSSALTSGIKHLPADRITGKRTASVLFGTGRVRIVAVAAVGLSVVYCAALALVEIYQPASLLLTVLLPVIFLVIAGRHIATADHEHLASLKVFKVALNRAIYATNLGIILSFILQYLRLDGSV